MLLSTMSSSLVGEGIQSIAVCNLTARCHLILHTPPLANAAGVADCSPDYNTNPSEGFNGPIPQILQYQMKGKAHPCCYTILVKVTT